MEIFTLLFVNILPLIGLIGLGYIAGRTLDVQINSMARVAIFIIGPAVIFGALANAALDPAYIFLPVMIYVFCALIAFGSYILSARQFGDTHANLIGMALATGNTGYFGLPVILALLGAQAAGLYILMNVAIILAEVTISYYIGARGHFSMRDSLHKVIRLPALHAAWLGIVYNISGLPFPDIAMTYWTHFTGAWVVIGMMLIGIGLSNIRKFRFNIPLLAWLFGGRFIVWPALMISLIALDKFVFRLYGAEAHIMLLMIGVVPLPANTVAYAAHLDIRPGEAATTVLLTTLFALFFIPAVFMGLGIEVRP